MNEEVNLLVPIKNESGSSIEGPNNSHSSFQESQDSDQFYEIMIKSNNIAANHGYLSHKIKA